MSIVVLLDPKNRYIGNCSAGKQPLLVEGLCKADRYFPYSLPMGIRRFFLLLSVLIGCLATGALAQTVQVPAVKLPHLQRYLNSTSDTTYIINFWATWCKPCIEELPYFEALTQQYANKPVKVILVSMDFVKDLEKKVVPFVTRKKLQSTVFLLDEPDQDFLINAIEPKWSGAIPATIILNNAHQQRLFIEKPVTPEMLHEYLANQFKLTP